MYMVRSTYRLSLSVSTHESDAGDSDRANLRQRWTFIWSADVPGKVKVFVCRVCRNAILMANNLRRRGCTWIIGCPHCDIVLEDSLHTLVFCPVARQMWSFI
ncbi:hypothetical protein Salat_0191400 [Sesamum alatum]|uniref:Reverse transcriptase zinc-binding domain-containing protein n=1 Tax=Sesamum alatum TaxID=300844 RepID=A0AAE1YY25_9LAMI|nr:hypothetical protein Salat_0191400 [Sesamum alatum]